MNKKRVRRSLALWVLAAAAGCGGFTGFGAAPGGSASPNSAISPGDDAGSDTAPATEPNAPRNNGQDGSDANAPAGLEADAFANPVRVSAYLASQVDPSKCVGLVGTSQGNVGLWPCGNNKQVSWTYTDANQLMHTSEKLCLVAAEKTYLGAPLVEKAPCSDSAVQKWRPLGQGWQHVASNACLSVSRGDLSDRAPLTLRPCTAGFEQLWRPLTPVATPVFDPVAQAQNFAARCGVAVIVDAVSEVSDANTRAFLQIYPNLEDRVRTAAIDDCNVLFSSAKDVGQNRSYVRVVLQDDPASVAAFGDNTLYIGVNYFIAQARDYNNANDLAGALRHELTHYYQFNRADIATPGYWIEGMAEYVRIVTGYAPLTDRRKGGAYTDSYRPTGFFLFYLEGRYPGLVRRMEKVVSEQTQPWQESWFTLQTGQTLNQLWSAYQASLP